jgi:hypothetical protein
MKKVILILMMGVSSMVFSQTTSSFDSILGTYQNVEGEFLKITNEFGKISFVRRTPTSIKAVGEIKLVDDEMHIVRKDVPTEYDLCYYVGNESLVICRPDSHRAWLWQRIK